MAARLTPFAAPRALVFRTRPQFRPTFLASPQCRRIANSKDLPKSTTGEGPNTDPLPDINEETVAIKKTMGGCAPDVEQGTPVEEVVRGDKAAQDKLPQIMKDELKAKSKSTPGGSRSYHTSAIRRQDLIEREPAGNELQPLPMTGLAEQIESESRLPAGFKFDPPTLPLPPGFHLKHRYDPLVLQVTNLLMEHGKKGAAQRNMGLILQYLRTTPPPVVSPARPLVPGAPPPTHLPLNPVLYLRLAIDSIAPLLKIRSIRGAAGGGMALPLPSPLGLRQRRRTAVMWILDAAKKRRNRGSGKGMFAQRIAEELVSVVEGRSSIWQRRDAIHKLAVSARANLNVRRRK